MIHQALADDTTQTSDLESLLAQADQETPDYRGAVYDSARGQQRDRQRLARDIEGREEQFEGDVELMQRRIAWAQAIDEAIADHASQLPAAEAGMNQAQLKVNAAAETLRVAQAEFARAREKLHLVNSIMSDVALMKSELFRTSDPSIFARTATIQSEVNRLQTYELGRVALSPDERRQFEAASRDCEELPSKIESSLAENTDEGAVEAIKLQARLLSAQKKLSTFGERLSRQREFEQQLAELGRKREAVELSRYDPLQADLRTPQQREADSLRMRAEAEARWS